MCTKYLEEIQFLQSHVQSIDFSGYKRAKISVIIFISIYSTMDAASLQRVPNLYRDIYQKNWVTIKDSFKTGTLRDMHHFPLFQNDDKEIISKVEHVMSKYNTKIKVNVAFGFILKNRTTGELKFFHVCYSKTIRKCIGLQTI